MKEFNMTCLFNRIASTYIKPRREYYIDKIKSILLEHAKTIGAHDWYFIQGDIVINNNSWSKNPPFLTITPEVRQRISVYLDIIKEIDQETNSVQRYFAYLSNKAENLDQVLGALPSVYHKFITVSNIKNEYPYTLRLKEPFETMQTIYGYSLIEGKM